MYLCIMIADIEQWLADGQRSYEVGVDLLSQYGGTAQQVRVFRGRSPRFAMGDLMGDLRRLSARSSGSTPPPMVAVPAVALRAKKELHQLWVQLSRLHLSLFGIGEENTPSAVAARVAMMEQRDPLIERFNALYEAKEAFFAGKLSEAGLTAVVDGRVAASGCKESSDEQPAELASLSDLELVKRLKAAKQGKIRSQNWLLFQQPTAAMVKNPLPDCPKRTFWAAKLEHFTRLYGLLLAEKEKRGL